MFPLVLPTPLSKKWGAKLAWTRKKKGQIPPTARESFAPAKWSGERSVSPIPAQGGSPQGAADRTPLPPQLQWAPTGLQLLHDT